MLFHISVGKVAKFRVNTSYRCYFILVGKLRSLELIHHINAIIQDSQLHVLSYFHILVAKFRVNTLYRCYYS